MRKGRGSSLWSSASVGNDSATAAAAAAALDPGSCFSIIFRGDWTLDLMMTDFDIMTTTNSISRDSTTSSKHDNKNDNNHDNDNDNNNDNDNDHDDTSLSSSSRRITRDEILDALDKVIRTYQNAKRQVSNEVLLLRYVWLDSDQVR